MEALDGIENVLPWGVVEFFQNQYSCLGDTYTALKRTLADSSDSMSLVGDDVEAGTRRLKSIVARADGLQKTGDRLGSAHHFANVLFNVIGEEIELGRLLAEARSLGDPHLLRLVIEYLPISFSRRHGDPSRPWNKFSINVKNRDGSKVLDYQGNWRDIFQNWEALCLSFPGYLEGVIGRASPKMKRPGKTSRARSSKCRTTWFLRYVSVSQRGMAEPPAVFSK